MLQTPLPSDFNPLNYQVEILCALLNSWPKIWAATTPIYRVPENFIQGQQQPKVSRVQQKVSNKVSSLLKSQDTHLKRTKKKKLVDLL